MRSAAIWQRVWLAAILCAMAGALLAQDSYDQPWRPQYHFTPSHNFMNDPNGMVFYKGEYHLFYQYNPEGQVWGHMSWGHAVGTDMVHWKHLPVAIPEDPKYMAYSGSAVVDWNNSSGLCKNSDPADHSCLIAIYAAAYKDRQKQHIAYSNDRGRTWTNYAGNPVIDLDAEDFRDPKVFWYAPQKKWVLVAVLADHRQALFFSSPDLKHWTKLSEFGPASDDVGQWECPDLLELPIEGTNDTRWVLIINRNPGAPAGGTGVRYLIGQFDGTQFVEKESAGKKLWADYGKDFYATNSFNDMPQGDPRKIWIGWTSNWLYAKDEPTALWRGAQSIPRTLTLRWVTDPANPKPGPSGELLMIQAPVRELHSLRGEPFVISDVSLQDANARLSQAGMKGATYEIEAEIEAGDASEIGFRLRKSGPVETLVGIIPASNTLFVDRTRSGNVYFNADFPGRYSTTLTNTKRVNLHIFVDRSSVEVFANAGEKVMTDRTYPPQDCEGIEIYSTGGAAKVVLLTVWQLRSIWGTSPNSAGYTGQPFHDERYAGGPQTIPGKLQCAYYDVGGEGIAYHDSDAVNHGSGELNPLDGSYLHAFRVHEGVDISYVKVGRQPAVDDNPFDLVAPPPEQLYVGWTQPGEWLNYTVNVATAGKYSVDLLYTSHQGGQIGLDLDGKPLDSPLTITSTANSADPLAWRQWHHWNLAKNLVEVELPAGVHVLTVRILTEGQMNVAYFGFRKTIQ
jgi:fructan beta-fructosidase